MFRLFVCFRAFFKRFRAFPTVSRAFPTVFLLFFSRLRAFPTVFRISDQKTVKTQLKTNRDTKRKPLFMTKRSNGYGLGLKNAVQTAFHGKRSTLGGTILKLFFSCQYSLRKLVGSVGDFVAAAKDR